MKIAAVFDVPVKTIFVNHAIQTRGIAAATGEGRMNRRQEGHFGHRWMVQL
ncbi:hypothetical protein [Komagataeibacter oboediens]|uniref:Uncharacterized protein n=1 Tax=Komagataeibacter oboediens TaxID=65958 RepID=A0ABS5SMQ0_9PROT|nr:hypothetical protein [Komagataeibacter oboediens]MBL7233265.1 hypothetical protein [Komagataeibacter oboediens]MBT0675507.1 hypothetical protein [Komagataeibacter oboediens]MBT0679891.1 hypothetical protein [Komagataeibacter oboediens]